MRLSVSCKSVSGVAGSTTGSRQDQPVQASSLGDERRHPGLTLAAAGSTMILTISGTLKLAV
jgi:hypothetical protein